MKLKYINLESIWHTEVVDLKLKKVLKLIQKEYNIGNNEPFMHSHLCSYDCMFDIDDRELRRSFYNNNKFKFDKSNPIWYYVPHGCHTNALFIFAYLNILFPLKNFSIIYSPDHFVCVEKYEDGFNIYDLDYQVNLLLLNPNKKYGNWLKDNIISGKYIEIPGHSLLSWIDKGNVDLYDLKDLLSC